MRVAAAGLVTVVLLVPQAHAARQAAAQDTVAAVAADPVSARATARQDPWPRWWLGQALCIHHYETRGLRDPWRANTGNGQYGGYQFSAGTYVAAGGRRDGRADLDTPREQTYRAWVWWKRRGRWGGTGGWPNTSRECGLT